MLQWSWDKLMWSVRSKAKWWQRKMTVRKQLDIGLLIAYLHVSMQAGHWLAKELHRTGLCWLNHQCILQRWRLIEYWTALYDYSQQVGGNYFSFLLTSCESSSWILYHLWAPCCERNIDNWRKWVEKLALRKKMPNMVEKKTKMSYLITMCWKHWEMIWSEIGLHMLQLHFWSRVIPTAGKVCWLMTGVPSTEISDWVSPSIR